MGNYHYSLGYRPDIEGLRGVAVLLVVLCHAGVPMFSGGFVGVDVFFVLSGYLISGLLIQEFSSNKRIAFGRFYLRRLQRLAPALFTMLVTVSMIVYFFLAPGVQALQHLSAATAAVWVSNLHFASGTLDYFSPEATQNLFLHTWSLSVEEQFYLVWPALVLLVLKYGQPGNVRDSIERLGTVLLYIVLVSLALCLYLSYQNTIAAYYLPTSRAWQFAAGAIAVLCTFWLKNNLTSISQVTPETTSIGHPVTGWIAATALVLTTVSLDSGTRYPGLWALAPTLATVMILITGASRPARWSFSRLLTLPPLVYLGNISYGWYLWHWPILVLGKLLFPGISHIGTAAAVALSLGLASVSYHFLEQPIRSSGVLRNNPRRLAVAACATMLSVVALHVYLLQLSEQSVLSPELEKYQSARYSTPVIYALDCDEWIHSAELKKCIFGAENPRHKAILIGDSVAAQWFSAFLNLGERDGWQLTVLTKSSCPMVDQEFFYKMIGRRFTECETWRDSALEDIIRSQPELVIMSSSRGYPFSKLEWELGTGRVLERFAGSVGSVKVLRHTPVLTFDAIDCLANQEWQKSTLPFLFPNACNTAKSTRPRDEEIFAALQEATMPFSNVDVVDLNDLICPADTCSAVQGETVVYRDQQHLTDSFVKKITPLVLKKMGLDETVPEPFGF